MNLGTRLNASILANRGIEIVVVLLLSLSVRAKALSQHIVIVCSSGVSTVDLVKAAILASGWQEIDGELLKRVSIVRKVIAMRAAVLLKPGMLDLVLGGQEE